MGEQHLLPQLALFRTQECLLLWLKASITHF